MFVKCLFLLCSMFISVILSQSTDKDTTFLLLLRVTDRLSGKPGNVREFDSCQEISVILLNIRKMSGENVVREKLPKTVYCKLHICVHTGI